MAPRGARGDEAVPHRAQGRLPNARHIRRNGLYMGCHNGIGPEARAYVMDTVGEFVRKIA